MPTNYRKLLLIGAAIPWLPIAGIVEAAVSSRTNPATNEVEIRIQDANGIDAYTVTDPGTGQVEIVDNGGCFTEAIVFVGSVAIHNHTHFIDYDTCDEAPGRQEWMTHYYPVVYDGDPWATGGPRYVQALSVEHADVNNDGILDMIVARESVGTLSVFVNRGDGTLFEPEVYRLDSVPATAETLNDVELPVSSQRDFGAVAGGELFGWQCTYSCGSSTLALLHVCATTKSEATTACAALIRDNGTGCSHIQTVKDRHTQC